MEKSQVIFRQTYEKVHYEEDAYDYHTVRGGIQVLRIVELVMT